MNDLPLIYDNADMARRQAVTPQNPDVPWLAQRDRITRIVTPPDFLHLGGSRRRVRVQINAPALPKEAPQ